MHYAGTRFTSRFRVGTVSANPPLRLQGQTTPLASLRQLMVLQHQQCFGGEYDGGLRFSVIRIDDSNAVFGSDSWAEVLNFVQAERDRLMSEEASQAAVERRAHDESLSRG